MSRCQLIKKKSLVKALERMNGPWPRLLVRNLKEPERAKLRSTRIILDERCMVVAEIRARGAECGETNEVLLIFKSGLSSKVR